MAINLVKGQSMCLVKSSGSPLIKFDIVCKWGSIINKGFLGLGKSVQNVDLDLDLSCIMVDADGRMIDHIYSTLYRKEFLATYGMPLGKSDSNDRALHQMGEHYEEFGFDSDIIRVDLSRISPQVDCIFFFLNTCGSEDFSQIPYASISVYEGYSLHSYSELAIYKFSADVKYVGMRALIMGKLYRCADEWKFEAIGDVYPDRNLCETINNIMNNYA